MWVILAVLVRSEGLTSQLLGVLLAASPQLSKGIAPVRGLPCPTAPTFKLQQLQRLNLFPEFPVEWAEAPTKIALLLHLSFCPILLPSLPHTEADTLPACQSPSQGLISGRPNLWYHSNLKIEDPTLRDCQSIEMTIRNSISTYFPNSYFLSRFYEPSTFQALRMEQ